VQGVELFLYDRNRLVDAHIKRIVNQSGAETLALFKHPLYKNRLSALLLTAPIGGLLFGSRQGIASGAVKPSSLTILIDDSITLRAAVAAQSSTSPSQMGHMDEIQ
jgi:hypothetical protein